MNDKYILTEDHRVVPEPDLLTWVRWFEGAERHVAKDLIGPYFVSTVQLKNEFVRIDVIHRQHNGPFRLW